MSVYFFSFPQSSRLTHARDDDILTHREDPLITPRSTNKTPRILRKRFFSFIVSKTITKMNFRHSTETLPNEFYPLPQFSPLSFSTPNISGSSQSIHENTHSVYSDEMNILDADLNESPLVIFLKWNSIFI